MLVSIGGGPSATERKANPPESAGEPRPYGAEEDDGNDRPIREERP